MFSAQDKPTIVNEGLTPGAPVNIPNPPLSAAEPENSKVETQVTVSSKPVLPSFNSTNTNSKHVIIKLLEVTIPAILILLAMVLASYLISQYKKPAQMPELTPVPTLIAATPVPTPEENPFKDWKGYVNRAAQISFRYPPNVKLSESSTGTTKTTISLTHEEDGSIAIGDMTEANNADALTLLKQQVGASVSFDQGSEDDFSISGLTGKSGMVVLPEGGVGINVFYVYVTHEDTTYLFTNKVTTEKDLFKKILGTVRFVSKGVTPEWQSYSNKEGSFTLSYPPTWVATASAQAVSIRKSQEDSDYQNLLIQVSTVTGKQSVQLSASELISSLQNLSGWSTTPTLDFRSFGSAQAQIISGVKDGAWQEYGVFWFRNTLVQMSWKDALLRQEQDNFDDILSTLKFK